MIKIFNKNIFRIFIISFIMTLVSSINIFAIDDGIYLVPTTTYYTNPDTGEVDDIGSGNTALGEAMARSALGEKALLEVEDGKIYVTFRIKLISNISDIKISTQSSKGGSYSVVSTTIKAENFSEDYADYRFQIKSLDNYVCLEFYVAPMGRNVKFYAGIDASKAVAGSGDFVTSIKVNSSSSNDTTSSTTSSGSSNDTTSSTTSSGSGNDTTSTTTSSGSSNDTTSSTTSSETTTSSTTNLTTSNTSSSTKEDSNENTKSESSTANKIEENSTTSESETSSSQSENTEEENEETEVSGDSEKVTLEEEAVHTYSNNSEVSSKTNTSSILTIVILIIIIAIFVVVIIKSSKKGN